MPLVVGVPRETAPLENRVALVPETILRLGREGIQVVVEAGAGAAAYIPDALYAEAGAQLVNRAAAHDVDVVARVQGPAAEDATFLRRGSILIGFLRPLDDARVVARLAECGVTGMAMELVPRTTRAQKMDALSAMATVAGYRAVLLAATALPKFFPLLTTAAGTVRPAKVLVLGAGVAGLQAIATARRLGAVVSAYDVRAAAREQVESVGARFVEIALETADTEGPGGYARALDEERGRLQVELLVPFIADADVVITTALIPGKPAPLLITREAVEAMAPGSVIVDLAAANGGNCALTRPGEVAVEDGVRILAPLNLAAEMPLHASQMYSRTVGAMISEFHAEGVFRTDPEDEIFRAVCVTHAGQALV
ncbi:MAG: Re/Si-specific NAD(P)(+) transhydrogenase subunit alpha [Gemmatimonadota bacterium]|nr:Re/Si-specific NAD(P)(+) transhydrogenase subunit alpha [Gemmatimonadota bacterium]